MKTNTRQIFLKIIDKKGQVRPKDLVENLQISSVAVHKHLKKLLKQNKITKIGKPPLVFYKLKKDVSSRQKDLKKIDKTSKDFIDNNYLQVTATGEMLMGMKGFVNWFKETQPSQIFQSLVQEYVEIRSRSLKSRNKNGLLSAKKKFTDTFEGCFLDDAFYADFYSLPKFGKTKLGQKVLYAKQSQNIKLMKQIVVDIKDKLNQLIKLKKIQASAFVPHSVPRKKPLLKIIKKSLNLSIPNIEVVKAYTGDVIVAQKSLSKLKDRVQNARETLIIKNAAVDFKRVLIIDDAVGSGATLNEIAKKLKQRSGVDKVYGFAIVGSMKGFEVITEI
ncbi:MAG: hypothetical protein U9Q63_01340 [Patescibacteria group bacterium]|nr:hypothetical protein [Patescibacteria group bacterium]